MKEKCKKYWVHTYLSLEEKNSKKIIIWSSSISTEQKSTVNLPTLDELSRHFATVINAIDEDLFTPGPIVFEAGYLAYDELELEQKLRELVGRPVDLTAKT